MSAAPYLRWAGSKRQLAPTIVDLVKELRRGRPFDRYIEPFVGSGAVFFAMREAFGQWRYSILGDACAELINAHLEVRWNVPDVRAGLWRLDRQAYGRYGLAANSDKVGQDSYLTIRQMFNDNNLGDINRASGFIWLNQSCFNGLWRVNAKGRMNVPYGRRWRMSEDFARSLGEASKALVLTDFVAGDFAETIPSTVTQEDVIYLDPPYIDVFSDYAQDGFGRAEHERLAQVFRRLAAAGATVIISINDVEQARGLYEGFERRRVEVRRSMAARSADRGMAGELLVTGGAK